MHREAGRPGRQALPKPVPACNNRKKSGADDGPFGKYRKSRFGNRAARAVLPEYAVVMPAACRHDDAKGMVCARNHAVRDGGRGGNVSPGLTACPMRRHPGAARENEQIAGKIRPDDEKCRMRYRIRPILPISEHRPDVPVSCGHGSGHTVFSPFPAIAEADCGKYLFTHQHQHQQHVACRHHAGQSTSAR